jgi:glucose-1-phosphate cytidylyltransferase
MKAVILAGGYGTRISEESYLKPKPMIEIGGQPILWHIMKYYSQFDINEFIICLGYKGYVIKEYFTNYSLYTSDLTINLANNEIQVHHKRAEPWNVTLIETGDNTSTGGRIKRIKDFLGENETFCLTYGDGLSNINLFQEIAFHKQHGKLATVCAVQPTGRFGSLLIEGGLVKGFQEKPAGDGGWINGGFFVLNSSVVDYIEGDSTVWENEPLQTLAKKGDLAPFFHKGFWQAMDTLRDKLYLEDLCKNRKAPWIIWE